MKLIDGQKIAEKIKTEIAAEIATRPESRPNLAIILAGDREDSKLYVDLKEREAKKVGIDTHLYKLTEAETEAELLEMINFLNQDTAVDGILVQLPLPDRFDTDKIIKAVEPQKDVDGFHPEHPDYIVSPVLAAVLKCLEEIKYDLEDQPVAVLYNSDIFGASLTAVLEKLGAKVRAVSVKDFEKMDEVAADEKFSEVEFATKEANVVISALGLPKFIKKDMIREGAALIDIGISKVGGKVLGDVDIEDVNDKAGYVTPVPGGIGPLTIALLFKNVLEIFRRRT
jgi:methylenetetrahydrofolate dehydrogenase (NADP+)/methenyltetrahydrofolate cyclohydrolase